MIRTRTLRTILGSTATVIATTALAAWLSGRVVSDRFGWSQWLLWIPTPAALLAALLGVAGACRPVSNAGERRLRLVLWGAVGVALAVYFLVIEHRFLRFGAGDPGALTLLQSSVYPGRRQAQDDYIDRLIDIGADVTVISNMWNPTDVNWLREELDASVNCRGAGPFVVFTKLRILKFRALAANEDEGIHIALFRLDATTELGRPITILAVDFPADPRRHRCEVARAARRMLESAAAPPPDIVVGDFNMTRNSASLNTLFPGLAHAYDQAGRGYGATFRRGFPLYHLDHALLADTVRATDYALVDLCIGRHLGQVVKLAPGRGD